MIHLSRAEFVRLVRLAYRSLPLKTRQAIKNVDIAVEEWPTEEELQLAGEHETLFGLYTGVPLIHRHGYDPALPDRILIFRQPILRASRSEVEAAREIRVTLLHEIGHYLGLEEDDLHRLGYG